MPVRAAACAFAIAHVPGGSELGALGMSRPANAQEEQLYRPDRPVRAPHRPGYTSPQRLAIMAAARAGCWSVPQRTCGPTVPRRRGLGAFLPTSSPPCGCPNCPDVIEWNNGATPTPAGVRLHAFLLALRQRRGKAYPHLYVKAGSATSRYLLGICQVGGQAPCAQDRRQTGWCWSPTWGRARRRLGATTICAKTPKYTPSSSTPSPAGLPILSDPPQ